jgi:hypothetical protein
VIPAGLDQRFRRGRFDARPFVILIFIASSALKP